MDWLLAAAVLTQVTVEEHPLVPVVEQSPKMADTSEFLASRCVFGDPIAEHVSSRSARRGRWSGDIREVTPQHNSPKFPQLTDPGVSQLRGTVQFFPGLSHRTAYFTEGLSSAFRSPSAY
jgi:hypothetical protein